MDWMDCGWVVGVLGVYLQSFKCTGWTTMAVAGESDEDICADAMAVDDHLEPADGWHGTEVSVFVG
jgi:hypothetical protein